MRLNSAALVSRDLVHPLKTDLARIFHTPSSRDSAMSRPREARTGVVDRAGSPAFGADHLRAGARGKVAEDFARGLVYRHFGTLLRIVRGVEEAAPRAPLLAGPQDPKRGLPGVGRAEAGEGGRFGAHAGAQVAFAALSSLWLTDSDFTNSGRRSIVPTRLPGLFWNTAL
jgi:hypothetical protein